MDLHTKRRFTKAKYVINSCRTKAHLMVADAYLTNFCKLFAHDTVTCTRLQNELQLKRIDIDHLQATAKTY